MDWQRGHNVLWIRRLLTGTVFTRLRPTVVAGLLSALFLILPAGAAGARCRTEDIAGSSALSCARVGP